MSVSERSQRKGKGWWEGKGREMMGREGKGKEKKSREGKVKVGRGGMGGKSKKKEKGEGATGIKAMLCLLKL